MQLSAEPSLSTPRHQTVVELTCMKQTDQTWAVSKEIWSSSYSLCRWMGGIRCGFCMVFMIEVWTLNGLRLGQSPCMQGSQCACRDQCPLLLPSAAAGAFLYSPIYRLSRHSSAARIAACLIVLLVKSVSQTRRLAARPITTRHQQIRSTSLIPAHLHAPRCRIPLFTFSIIAATSAHPTSLISINTRFLRSPFCQLPRFYRLSNNPLVVHLTAVSHLSHPSCTRLHPTIVERVDGHLALPIVSLRDTSSPSDIDTFGLLHKRSSRRPVLPDDQPSSWPWTSNTLPTVQPEELCTCSHPRILNTLSTRFLPSSRFAALCRVLPRSRRVTIWSQGLPKSLLHALVCRVR